MLRLFDITLVCADCRNPDAGLSAMSICLNQVEFDQVIFFTDQEKKIYPGKVIKIRKLANIHEYSYFIFKELHNYITTKYLLICQFDGFIINPSAWDNKFYEYDYIGAPWWHHGGRVGNGGFSFRSLKLHKILSHNRFDTTHPEDAAICGRYRDILEKEYAMKFAPREVAERFSLETSADEMNRRRPFGFHGRGCVGQATKITSNYSVYQGSIGVKCYLKPFINIPMM